MAAGPDRNRDAYNDPPRSIFSTLWFRALVVIVALGIVAVIAVPHVLDMVNPSLSQMASKPASPPATGMPVAPAPPTAPPAADPPAPATSTADPSGSAPKESGTTPGMVAVTPALPAPETPNEAKTPPAPAQAAPGPVAAAKPAMTPPATLRRVAAGVVYWVQVGAFKDQATAKRLVERLRADNFNVVDPVKGSRSGAAASAGEPPVDRYNVFVSGMAADELTAKLTAKGLAADPVAGGVVIKPSLPLREAVTLSRELAGEGLRVQVRRAAAPSASASPTLYRVRVGSFADRESAQAALKELEAKGYKAFIARGNE